MSSNAGSRFPVVCQCHSARGRSTHGVLRPNVGVLPEQSCIPQRPPQTSRALQINSGLAQDARRLVLLRSTRHLCGQTMRRRDFIMVLGGAGATGGQAADHRVPRRRHTNKPAHMGRRIRAAAARARLGRGPHRRHRIPLGGGPRRPLCRDCGRQLSNQATSCRHMNKGAI